MSDCRHEQFEAEVSVARITDGENGPPTAFVAHLRIVCAVCREQFVFPGLPRGLSALEPTCEFDRSEARLPIRPASVAVADGPPAFPGYVIEERQRARA